MAFALNHVEIGDCREILPTIPDGSFQCCVTSPPYWALRNYLNENQIGLEDRFADYLEKLVVVFREVRRVLRDDGTLWLNLGDCYFGGGYANHKINGEAWAANVNGDKRTSRQQDIIRANPEFKPKDLVGAPWRVALALQADGWFLRSDIVWQKSRAMPEPVRDRPVKAHEYVFLLSKSSKYFYDADAIAEQASGIRPGKNSNRKRGAEGYVGSKDELRRSMSLAEIQEVALLRNARSVWTLPTEPFDGMHFAVMPKALVTKCILAGSKLGSTVLDPFMGSGTVAEIAESLGRTWFGCEVNPEYAALSVERTRQLGLQFTEKGS